MAIEEARAELAAAQTAFNEWFVPQKRLELAQRAYGEAMRQESQRSMLLEQSKINSSDPLLAASIKSLWKDFQTTNLAFETWGSEDRTQSNIEIVSARARAIRAAIDAMEVLQKQGARNCRAKIREIVSAIPSLVELEMGAA